MSKKTIILTQKQLDEIVGGDSTYLDNVDSDFVQDGVNSVYTGEKTDDSDTKPVTSDKFAKQIRRPSGFYGLDRNIQMGQPVMIACSKSTWEKRNLVKEDNSELVNTNFGIGQSTKDNIVAANNSAGANAVKNGNVSYGNAKVIKSRMNKLQKQAQKGDVGAQQKYQNMGGKVLQDAVTQKLDNATSLVKRDKENRSNMGFNNVYQKPGGTKNSGNGEAHSTKNNPLITYDVNESRSIKSRKLQYLLNSHGGFSEKRYSYLKHNNHDIRMTNADIHNITDDQVIGVVDYEKIKSTIDDIRKNKKFGYVPGDDIDYIKLMDGSYLLLLVKNAHYYRSRIGEEGEFKELFDKKQSREANRQYSGKHNNYYRWKSTDAEDLMFNNPYYKNWSEDSKNQLRNKIKNDYKK